MKEQDFEIYDMITGQKITKDKVKPGTKYIIYYPKDNWKIRTGYINENGEIENESYLAKDDKITEIKNTLYRILERKGNTNIRIDDMQETKLNNLEIGMPLISISYQDVNGVNRNRILNANTLKDIYAIGEDGQELIQLDGETNISYLRVGENNNISKEKQYSENREYIHEEEQPKTHKNPTRIYINGGINAKNLEVSKGNLEIYLKKDGEELCFDLRTDEGVEALKEHWEKEQEQEQQNT